jgi:hypothetical protein
MEKDRFEQITCREKERIRKKQYDFILTHNIIIVVIGKTREGRNVHILSYLNLPGKVIFRRLIQKII